MSDEYTDKRGYLNKYFVRWKTAVHRDNTLVLIQWEVCDRRDAHKVLAVYKERSEAVGVCKLMNSIEEETA